MKWVVIVALVAALAGGAGVWVWGQRGKPGQEIVFRWDHARDAAMPVCSATAHRDCMTGFTLTDKTDDEVISDRIPPDARSYTYRPGWEIPVGYRHLFALTADGYGADGLPVRSEATTVSVENPAWKFKGGESGPAVVK